jgi:TonB family protein
MASEGFGVKTSDWCPNDQTHVCREQPMTTNFVSSGLAVRFVFAVAMGLSLDSVVHLHASVVELMAVPDDTHSSDSGAQAADGSGVCEREAEKLLGQKAVRIGRSTRAPKKLRHVPPKYPELPPGTQASGVWLGEILIDNSGKISRVWTLREVRFVPPFPAFNNAIADAIQKWQFEPLLVQGKATPACMTVTINIDWQ